MHKYTKGVPQLAKKWDCTMRIYDDNSGKFKIIGQTHNRQVLEKAHNFKIHVRIDYIFHTTKF